MWFHIGANMDQRTRVYIGTMTATSLGIRNISDGSIITMENMDEANKNIGVIDAALKMIDETVGIFSTVTISGFERSREFWVKRRMKSTGETDFQYVAVYVIDKENLMFQIDRALGKIEAKTAEEQKALTDIKTLIKTSAAGAGYIDFGKGE